MERRRSLRIDRERLAWAAGFYDGEGTTFAKSDSDRPGYHQLYVSVPQAGISTPRVLERFRSSLFGMGRIDPPSTNGAYVWRARGFVDAQQSVICLWPYLGTIKRQQAAAAMRRVSGQFSSGRYRARPPKSRPVLVEHRISRPSDPSRLDRAWAAGFLDAEGCFGLARSHRRGDGSSWYRIRASASQKGEIGRPPEVLEQLHRVLDGIGRIERHGEPDDFKWLVEGVPAVRQVLTIVGPWLSSVKREQAWKALDDFLGQRRIHGDHERCVRGHAYDKRVLLQGGRSRGYCNTCRRLLDRRKRAAQGVAPRQFRNVARRYTE
ncbi:MAG TPA: hypothetical protein VIN70_03840 [Candidatus Limnocylindria bacterium]|jgi:hypothetical protein